MTRRPPHEVDDTADTHDELVPVDTRPPAELEAIEAEPRFPYGSGDRDPVRAQLDDDYFGRGKDDPWAPRNVDAAATEHERRLVTGVDARCRAAEARAAAAESRAETAERRAGDAEQAAKKMSRRWAALIVVVTSAGALVTPLSIMAAKKLNAAAEARGAAAELERQRLADHAMLLGHDRALSEIRGVLWTLNPAGVLRLQGAARAPAPDPDLVSP